MLLNKRNIEQDFIREKKSALRHWLMQKVSALLLLPLLCWFLYTLKDLFYGDYKTKLAWFHDYSNSIFLASFIIVALYHLRLGLTAVIDDYVHNEKHKNFLFSFISILCLLFAIFTLIVVAYLSLGDHV